MVRLRSSDPTRYHIGLVLFVLPLLLGFLEPYLGHLIPGLAANRVVFCVACDLMFLSSLFVLGGEFWDKLRALFVHGAQSPISRDRDAIGACRRLTSPSAAPAQAFRLRILEGC